MAHYRPARDRGDSTESAEPFADTVVGAVARIAGLVLLLVGLWTAVAIVREAWILYSDPKNHRVEAFARAIEAGTHLDALLSPEPPTAGLKNRDRNGGATDGRNRPQAAASRSDPSFRVSYFLAWGFIFVMLLLVSRLSIAAIKAGADLALYDVQIRRFKRELLREIAREHGQSR